MQIALLGKNKMCFVDGSFSRPANETSDAFLQWRFVDSTVLSWILNSMSKELSEAFVYANSARTLWLELAEKFGEGDNPRIFNIKKQLAGMAQGTDSLVVYSTKLKKLWEELNCLEPRPDCSCTASKKYADINSSTHVMQFLMGLNSVYDTAVNNILMLDPLPPFNRVYSMIARLERQVGLSPDSATFSWKRVFQT